jgi:hypothetical protein
MDYIINLISDPNIDNILRFLITLLMIILLVNVRIILRRIRLSEFKHVATIHALSKSLGNGFLGYYKDKLHALIEEYNFKTGKQ